MLVGESPGIKANQFLATEASYADFILKFSVRLVGDSGNSGVQFRSVRVPGTEMSGYQADVGPGYWGTPLRRVEAEQGSDDPVAESAGEPPSRRLEPDHGPDDGSGDHLDPERCADLEVCRDRSRDRPGRQDRAPDSCRRSDAGRVQGHLHPGPSSAQGGGRRRQQTRLPPPDGDDPRGSAQVPGSCPLGL